LRSLPAGSAGASLARSCVLRRHSSRSRTVDSPDSLQIRSTDYLALEVAAFNSMVAALRARATEQERARAEVISALEALSDHAAKSEDDVLSALAARALERVRSSGGRVS
jgi:hypothetical protein